MYHYLNLNIQDQTNGKTSTFIEVTTCVDDQLISCFWLSVPGCLLIPMETVRVYLVFHRNVKDSFPVIFFLHMTVNANITVTLLRCWCVTITAPWKFACGVILMENDMVHLSCNYPSSLPLQFFLLLATSYSISSQCSLPETVHVPSGPGNRENWCLFPIESLLCINEIWQYN